MYECVHEQENKYCVHGSSYTICTYYMRIKLCVVRYCNFSLDMPIWPGGILTVIITRTFTLSFFPSMSFVKWFISFFQFSHEFLNFVSTSTLKVYASIDCWACTFFVFPRSYYYQNSLFSQIRQSINTTCCLIIWFFQSTGKSKRE